MYKKSGNMDGRKRKCSHVAEDIVAEILVKLPVKSLVRFKCVCKAWNARFRSPDFIRAHYRNQETVYGVESKHSKFLLKRDHGESNYCFTSLECRVDGEYEFNVKETENIFFPFLAVSEGSRWEYTEDSIPRALGPCNGVICLSDDENAALWNPATREFKLLPASNVFRPPNTHVCYSAALAFGYDHENDDYKVLRVFVQKSGVTYNRTFRFEIYSLRKNEWREAHLRHPFGRPADTPTICIDGVCHSDHENFGVMSFDLVRETFTFTKYLDFRGLGWGRLTYANMLAPFDKRVAAVRYDGIGTRELLDVWVLEEIGVMESWTKKMIIGPFPDEVRFLGFWKERVFVQTREENMAVYSRGIKILRVQVFHTIQHATH